MRLKIISKRTKWVSILIVFVFLSVSLFYFISSLVQASPSTFVKSGTVFPKQEYLNVGLPIRLKIPKINVDTPIESVGLTLQGAMDAPKIPSDVAWFNLGSRPGEIGSAVISGHYGWKNNIAAVFDNLSKLKKGDKVYIEDEKGIVITFVVRETKKYSSNADASDVFTSHDEKSHLNLITCGGVWNKTLKSYSNRLVVFADKE
jgi:LPXTG-site transpeptidase (sortase) family protein